MTEYTRNERLSETVTGLREGELDPETGAKERCKRIGQINDTLRAFVEESERQNRVLTEASQVRDRYPEPGTRPILFGVPVGVKDIIHVDGLTTRAGSAVPPKIFEGSEASSVKRLRKAGAIVLGKTVTTEFAGRSPGLTRNPHNTAHTPGGSSSGSAAAVAAGLCPLALGTQTIGSVIRPAAYCGIVGMKPSFGRVPRDGVLLRSESVDHVGIFTQDVEGIQIAAGVLCDNWSGKDLDQNHEPTIAVPTGPLLEEVEPAARRSFYTQLEQLEANGAIIKYVSVPTFEEFSGLKARHSALISAELAMIHEPWFDDYRDFYRAPMVETIKRGREVSAGAIAEGRSSRLELRQELEAIANSYGIDIWATPSALGGAPETIQSTGNPVMNLPWTHAGLPSMSLPAGTTREGLPLGIQFVGGYSEDEKLIAMAKELSTALPEKC